MHSVFVYDINHYMMKASPRFPFRGPSLILLAIVHILLFVAGLVAAATLRHGAPYVTPFGSAEALRSFLELSPAAVRVSNFFLFASAVPFGIFAVTTVSRLRFLGVRATGTNIALLGGLIATIALILSGSAGWILSLPEVTASAPVMKAIVFLNFLMGGVVFAVGFGLFAAGVSVTSYFMRLLPRWMVVAWNGCCNSRRALLIQPYRVPGKLFHSGHQIPGRHLDGCGRRRTDEGIHDHSRNGNRRKINPESVENL